MEVDDYFGTMMCTQFVIQAAPSIWCMTLVIWSLAGGSQLQPPHLGCLTLGHHSVGALVGTGALLALLTLRKVFWAD